MSHSGVVRTELLSLQHDLMPLPHSKQSPSKGSTPCLRPRARMQLQPETRSSDPDLSPATPTVSVSDRPARAFAIFVEAQGGSGWTEGPKGPEGLYEERCENTVFPSCRMKRHRGGGSREAIPVSETQAIFPLRTLISQRQHSPQHPTRSRPEIAWNAIQA